MAVMEAQQWCDKPENHDELADHLSKRQWINAPVADIIDRIKGKFDYGIPGKVVENSPHIMNYWKDFASYPFQSHDLWFITEDIRWGKFEPDVDAKGLIEKVNREDVWRDGREGAGRPGARRSRPRPRAARRPSSTARSSIRRTRAPTSRAWRSSAPKSDDARPPERAAASLHIVSLHWRPMR